MKTIELYFYRILGVGIILLLSLSSCKDEENGGRTSENEFTKQIYSLPQAVSYHQNIGRRLFDTFYPIGWSKSGKVAYIVEPADEATGYYFFNFIILDGNTDKQLFEWKIDIEDADYEGSLEQTWQTNYELFSAELNKHKIYPIKSEIKQFPFSYNNQNYYVSHDISYEKHEFFPFDVVSHAQISINTDYKTNEVYNQAYDADLILNIKASHCLFSPFSENALLLIADEQRGYEGPPHIIRLNVVTINFADDGE